MKRTFKISSLILAVCMVFSVMTGICALADDALSVVDWNADSDFITVDFSHAVSSLTGKVTLSRTDGTTTQDLTNGLILDGTKSEVSTSTTNTFNSWTIKPAGGITAWEEGDATRWIYTLTLTDVEADGASTLASYKKTFYVELIDDDMDVNTFTAIATGHNSYSNDEDGNIVSTSTYGGTTGQSNYYPTSLMKNLGEGNTPDLTDDRNYTMKAKFSFSFPAYTTDTTSSGLVNSSGNGRVWHQTHSLQFGFMSHQSTTSTNATINNFKATGSTSVNVLFEYYPYEYANRNNRASRIYLYQGGGTQKAGITTWTKIFVPTTDSVTGTDSFSADTKLAYKDGRVSVFLEGEKVLDTTVTDVNGAPVLAAYWKASKGSESNGDIPANIDDYPITISGYELTHAVAYYGYTLDKTEGVMVDEDTITVTFDEPVAEGNQTTDCVTLFANCEEVDAEHYSVAFENATTAVISLSGLKGKTTYEIVFDDVIYSDEQGAYMIPDGSFVTGPEAFDINEFAACDEDGNPVDLSELGEGDVLCAKALIKNNRCAETQSFVATVCIYNSKGQLCNIAGGAYELDEGESTGEITASVTCEADTTYSIKCFVWDSFTGMNTSLYEVIE